MPTTPSRKHLADQPANTGAPLGKTVAKWSLTIIIVMLCVTTMGAIFTEQRQLVIDILTGR